MLLRIDIGSQWIKVFTMTIGSNHSRHFFATGLAILASCVVGSALASSTTVAETALQQYRSDYVVDVFEVVATGVASEPYAGLQRGAEGTALDASGNSIDQAILLRLPEYRMPYDSGKAVFVVRVADPLRPWQPSRAALIGCRAQRREDRA